MPSFRPNRSSSSARYHRSLARSLDARVLALVREYVAELPATSDPTLRISVSQVYAHVSSDRDLTRTKKPVIEKAIERAIDVLQSEAADDDDGEEDGVDSEFDGLDGLGPGAAQPALTAPGENTLNAVNARIVNMWRADGAGSAAGGSDTVTPPTPAPTTPADEGGAAAPVPVLEPAVAAGSVAAPSPPKKRKERRADREDGGKRQKAEASNWDPPQNVSLADVGGLEDVAHQLLEDIALPLQHPEIYEHTGIAPPRGVLLHGPPGCGKTMLANAIAGFIGLPFISVSAPSIVSGMSGESEKKLRELFDEAREKAPCIVFMDEIDAITPKRESVQREMERRIVAQMLTCMDDLTLEKLGGKAVVIIGATNRPDSLDPALRRAGRFDREIGLTVPDEVGREKYAPSFSWPRGIERLDADTGAEDRILKVLCQKLRLSGDFDFKVLAKMTPGFVGADLKSLASAAGVTATKRMLGTLMDSTNSPTEQPPVPTSTDSSSTPMDLDHVAPSETSESLTAPASTSRLTALQRFLTSHPARLTPDQLSTLSITNADFLTALPSIQPSSKREGFATVPDVTWADIGALHPIRQELQMSIVQPIAHPELFAAVGISAPTGVLLWGPPGCGKTLLAKAVANESRANFISVRGPELLNKFVGESERAVRQVFSRARASKPCVIFFDELDALVPRRDDSGSESSARVVNTLLTELDGLEDRRGVFVVAATNRPDVIDPAMLRPGRLDKPLLVDLPAPEERLEILKTLTKKTPLDLDDLDLEAIASDGRAGCFSGADLAALVREASTAALRKACFTTEGVIGVRDGKVQVKVGKEEFEGAFAKVRPSVSEDERDSYRELATRFGVQHLVK